VELGLGLYAARVVIVLYWKYEMNKSSNKRLAIKFKLAERNIADYVAFLDVIAKCLAYEYMRDKKMPSEIRGDNHRLHRNKNLA
jgi:hypothetical protein